MDNQAKVSYLKEYTSIVKECEEIREHYMSKTYNIQAKVVSDTPTAKNFVGDSVGARLGKMESVNELIESRLSKLEHKRASIIKAIDNISDSQLRRLLWFRYIDGMIWEDLADKMNYTTTSIHRLHRIALNKIVISWEWST